MNRISSYLNSIFTPSRSYAPHSVENLKGSVSNAASTLACSQDDPMVKFLAQQQAMMACRRWK